jgi:hypothetical protein
MNERDLQRIGSHLAKRLARGATGLLAYHFCRLAVRALARRLLGPQEGLNYDTLDIPSPVSLPRASLMSTQSDETHLSRAMKRRRRRHRILQVVAVLVVSLCLVALIDGLLNPNEGTGTTVRWPRPTGH